MTKILVTGATGNIGRMTIKHLMNRKPANVLACLARDPSKATDLAAEGIDVRQGDYFDYRSLVNAFSGIDKLMLVSAIAFTDRDKQHQNAIDAAVEAGVKHIVFMPIIHEANSEFNMPQITKQDLFVEEKLKSSSLTYTLLRHPPFIESIDFYIGSKALEVGVQVPEGEGKAGFASRNDLAEAHAVVLSEQGHENKAYSLYGDPAVSFADIARILSEIGGKPVPYVTIADKEYTARMVSEGIPAVAADFLLSWTKGICVGEWDTKSNDLERLIGRKPKTVAEYLRNKAK